ncbi:unnamed protein product [Chrysoparadoxa australica]
MRMAAERDPLDVVQLMERHKGNAAIWGVGLQQMGKSDLLETSVGIASPGGAAYIRTALETLRVWSKNAWLVAEALGALATLSSLLAHRKYILEQDDWLDDVVERMMMLPQMTQEVMEINPRGEATRFDISIPTPKGHLIAIHGCKFISYMAADASTREYLAEKTLPAIENCVVSIPDDPVLSHAASMALYNMVFKTEAAHSVIAPAMTRHVRLLLNELPEGAQEHMVRAIVERTLKVLEDPEGWRGRVDVDGENGQQGYEEEPQGSTLSF